MPSGFKQMLLLKIPAKQGIIAEILGNRLPHCYSQRLDTELLGNHFVVRLARFQVKFYGFFFGITLRVAARECWHLYRVAPFLFRNKNNRIF
jgi:hypothetical protein